MTACSALFIMFLSLAVLLWGVRRRLTTKLSDSRRRATVERTTRFQITRDSQTESAAAVRCSALVRPRHRVFHLNASGQSLSPNGERRTETIWTLQAETNQITAKSQPC